MQHANPKLINPGILVEQTKKQQKDFLINELTILIHDANFIDQENEKNWITLLPYFSDNFLEELKQMIIRENLRYLSKKNIN